ncbi:MAG: HAD-IA family hydrolase [Deltaproteobacteria bacterium]|nr:HAD-IA family hydrolase [Deltaproteobacteria bacterium]MBW2413788.1 HAD-IA family hydrolase [Deltaproteobacteria bacterium]
MAGSVPARSADVVLFDFDYTLADSSPGILECVRFAMTRLGHDVPLDDEIRAQIGQPLQGSLARFFGADAAPSGGWRDADYVRLFVERADQVMAGRTSMLDGVPEVLATLRSAGLRLGVVSTKFRYRIEQVLGREGLRDRFDCIVGGEDVEKPKPHPQALERGLDTLGVARDRAVYVGDSLVDAEAAARAGLRFVGVLSGVTAAGAFDAHPVDALLPSVRELPALLGAAR